MKEDTFYIPRQLEGATPETVIEQKKPIELSIEIGYENFIPIDFKNDPARYFETFGKQVKPAGEKTYNDNGDILQNPDNVMDFPVWKDGNGNELQTVCKRINPSRGEVKKNNDPFYEYNILRLLNELQLPSAKPIAKIEQNGLFYLVMEKVQGWRWSELSTLREKAINYTEDDFNNLKAQAKALIDDLKIQFQNSGIMRQPVMEMDFDAWEYKDMIFDIDLDNKKVVKIIPTDWEITTIDWIKVNECRKNFEEKQKIISPN